jgi:hypothetical protein
VWLLRNIDAGSPSEASRQEPDETDRAGVEPAAAVAA